MPARIRVGLLGAGRIGRFHANTVAYKTAGAELVAISDVMAGAAAALAAATDAPHWGGDPAVVLADPSIDAVIIATPGPTHAELITRAAEAGKHVFCEKPIALELAEIDAALAAVARAGVKLQIGFQRRFDTGYLRAKELIDGGKIGDLQIIHSRTRDPDLPSLAYLRSCGGLFRDTSVHDFDSIRWLAGAEVASVYAAGAVLIDPIVAEAGDVDTAVVTLRLTNGAIATVDNSRRAVYGYDVRAEVFGSAGSVEVSRPSPTAAIYRSPAGIGQDHVFEFLDLFKDAYEEEIRSFITCVRTGATPRVTGEDGRMATVIGLAAQESVRMGAEVRP